MKKRVKTAEIVRVRHNEEKGQGDDFLCNFFFFFLEITNMKILNKQKYTHPEDRCYPEGKKGKGGIVNPSCIYNMHMIQVTPLLLAFCFLSTIINLTNTLSVLDEPQWW